MTIVKVTHPKHWRKETLPCNYLHQSPQATGVWGNYKFEFNTDCDSCDYWVIHGNLDQKETVEVRKAHMFISSEEATTKVWDQRFLDQFAYVITSQAQVTHPGLIRTQYICAWQVHHNYDYLAQLAPPNKTKQLSTITSDSTWTSGHKQRFAFVNQLKGHFKNQLHWYGQGNQFIKNKWDGLIDYQYSVAIENSTHLHYWTEKIADCFLAYTIPIYFGCTNISDYFPENSFIPVDWSDLEGSIARIETAMANQHYEKNLDALIQARTLILDQYQFIPKVSKLLDELPKTDSGPSRITLYPDTKFIKKSLAHRAFRKLAQQLKSP